jgi:SNF2 family DNA or RNA helicase
LWAADYVMEREGGKTLIVGQLSTLERVWGDSIFRNFLHRRTYRVLTGSAERRSRLLKDDVDFYIINYEGLNIGAGRSKNKLTLARLSREIAERSDIKIAVVDEASAYGDAQTLRSRVARLVISPRKYVWLLTGTPYQTAPTDAYGLAKIVNNMHGESFRSFRLRTMLQVTQFKWVPRQQAKEEVARVLSPSIRFTQDDCFDAKDVAVMRRDAGLSAAQHKLCNELRKELLVTLDGVKLNGAETPPVIEAVNEAALRTKLLQIACGEVYDDRHEAHHVDNKDRISVLLEVIAESPKKTIVFAPFSSVLRGIVSAVSPRFDTILVDGSITGEARDAALKAFQDPQHPSRVLVAHPGPIARGLDLTSAATVVWFAPTDKPEDYVQANQRINGPHQTHLRTIMQISSTGVEREIYRRLEANESLAGAIYKLIEERRLS